LRAEDHEEELLIRVVGESLAIRFYLNQFLLIKKINERTKVSSVSTKTIGVPDEYSVELSNPDVGY
jgi:hypothetical protein